MIWLITEKQLAAMTKTAIEITEKVVAKVSGIMESKPDESTTSKDKKVADKKQEQPAITTTTEKPKAQPVAKSATTTTTTTTTATPTSTPVVATCEQPEVVSVGVTTPGVAATAKILSAVWKNEAKDKEIQVGSVEKIVCVAIKTQGFDNDDELTINIKENKKDAESLKEIKLKLQNNEITSDTSGDNSITIDKDWVGKELIIEVTSDKADLFEGKKLVIACCSHYLKKEDIGDLIKELNIKLAGFGEKGNTVPENKFSEKTENAVKQFQRDYMKVTQTGMVCKHFFEKLDKFCEDYYFKIDTDSSFKVKCPCTDSTITSTKKGWKENKCADGFGKGRASLIDPKKNGPEKPGIHRSLLWAISAMKFYLDKVETSSGIKLVKFHSNYRCIADNIRQGRNSTNHMGNAIDIHVTSNTVTNCDKIRELFAVYCGAQYRWTNATNRFCLEPSIASYYEVEIKEKDDPKKTW